MVFRIRHENFCLLMAMIAAFLLLIVVACVCIVHEQTLVLICTLILLCGIMILFALVQTVRTKIVVSDDAVVIRHLLIRKKIAMDEIRDVRIERYSRLHKVAYREQRMRMVITTDRDKKTVLTDKAMAGIGKTGLLHIGSDVLPDDAVPLYQAYRFIVSMRHDG